jgi:NitT/TauT family transport system substrate-binding protein
MQKKFTIVIVLIVVIIAAFFTIGRYSDQSINTIKIGYNSQSLNYAPIMVGLEKGFFESEKYNLEFMPLKSGKEIRQSVATGQLDMGATSATNFFTSISVGAPLKIISPMTMTRVLLFVRPDNEIQTFEDLRGKTIQGGKIGQSEAVFINALKKEGISVSEIEFKDIDKEYRAMALMEKRVLDAIPGSSYNDEGYGDFGVVIHREWLEKGYGDQYWPNTVIATNTDFLENEEEVVEFVIQGLIKSQKFIKENQEESAQIISDHINKESFGTADFTPNEILNSWSNGLNYSLWYDPSILVEMAQLAFENRVLEKNLTQDDLLDLRFKNMLEESQNEVYESY